MASGTFTPGILPATALPDATVMTFGAEHGKPGTGKEKPKRTMG